MTYQDSPYLLPIGFYDLLFDEAEQNHKNINLVLDEFLNAGYRLIKTPIAEFLPTNSEQLSSCNYKNSFQTIDVISGKNLVFRNDITPQISRLLATRLKQKKLPLKLCYVGDVLHAKSDNLYADRQQTQVGIEFIGGDKQKSDFAVIESILRALSKIKIGNKTEKLLIEFSSPDFLEKFLAEITVKEKEKLREAIMKKNLSAIKNLAGENAEIIAEIAIANDNLENLISRISSRIKSKKTIAQLKNKLDEFQKISAFLQKNFPKVETRFDLFGDHESSYHAEISFDIFCGNFSYPIARGGNYRINGLSAVGATIYMNRLRKI